MQRRKARELVLQALYQQEFVDASIDEIISELDAKDQRQYIEETLNGIAARLPELDGLIDRYAIGWRVERFAILDRNILRLGLYELLHSSQIPAEVAIDEAVELAKRYGTDNARSFINGILDRVWKESKAKGNPPASNLTNS
jgi:transcription antitermination protein NusB